MEARDTVMEYCNSCEGSGIDPEDKYSHCIPCNGRGYNTILSYKEGIWEAVEWIQKESYRYSHRTMFWTNKWKAKLKEWGLEL